MNSTDIVIQKIIDGDYTITRTYSGCEVIYVKYNSKNRVELWLEHSLSITTFSSSYAQYLRTKKLPVDGLSADEYFNMSLELDVPDIVLKDNIKKIINSFKNNINQSAYSIEIKLC
ncbi:hypothetical protein XaC1_454 [Xanthomonas phage XaC1]|nr:hypothetical protein XaC1_454 [Xanthomonas phage XaC1]